MTLTAPLPTDVETGAPPPPGEGAEVRRGGWFVRITILIVVALWLVPTVGVLITSFRPESVVNTSGWWTTFAHLFDPAEWTLQNYRDTLDAQGFENAFLNSLAVTIPATVIPITIAAFAAYAFSWMEFRGRYVMFVAVVGLLVVPLQMALIPILRLYVDGGHVGGLTIFPDLDLNGTFLGVWLAHTAFGLPLAVYLLRNFIGSLPSSIIESAKIDGADHFTIFWRLVGAGARGIRHLPVPVGLERPAGGLRVPRGNLREPGAHDRAAKPDRLTRRGLAPAHLGRVPHDDPSPRSVLLPPALLHPGSHRRIGQGLMAMATRRAPRGRAGIGPLEPLSPQRKWLAITVATLLLVLAFWSLLAGLVSDASDEPGGPNPAAALAFGLALVPFVFVLLAFLSEHPRAPGAVLRAMGWAVLVGIPVYALVGDAVTGIVAGLGAGGIKALRMDADHNWRARALGVLAASGYTLVLVALTGAMALLPAPIFPLTAIGIADHLSERRAEQRRESPSPAGSTPRPGG
jgi:alpha-glucoside transport system permease protein